MTYLIILIAMTWGFLTPLSDKSKWHILLVWKRPINSHKISQFLSHICHKIRHFFPEDIRNLPDRSWMSGWPFWVWLQQVDVDRVRDKPTTNHTWWWMVNDEWWMTLTNTDECWWMLINECWWMMNDEWWMISDQRWMNDVHEWW